MGRHRAESIITVEKTLDADKVVSWLTTDGAFKEAQALALPWYKLHICYKLLAIATNQREQANVIETGVFDIGFPLLRMSTITK